MGGLGLEKAGGTDKGLFGLLALSVSVAFLR
jgi:hypothetical protein